jgi:Domain of unknown function (DUF4190)
MTNGGRPPGSDEPRGGWAAPSPSAGAPHSPPPSAPPPITPPAPPYGSGPFPQYTPTTPVRTNGLAIASLVLGIIWIFWVGSILAVIFGHVALSQIKRSMGTIAGRGLAIAGLVLGYVGLATLALVIVLAAAGVIDSATPEECRNDRAVLRAAERLYFRDHGHYTDEEGLVDARIIQNESDLHSIELIGSSSRGATNYIVVDEAACN